MLFAPLEQFQILVVFNNFLFGYNFAIVNLLIIGILTLFLLLFIFVCNSAENFTFYYVPNTWQIVLETIFNIVYQLVSEILTKNNEKYLPFLMFIFNFIFCTNIIGLLPYSFTATSHIFVTFYLSFTVFLGLIIITINKHGFKFFALFLPQNTTFFLALILVPIEFLSYLAKPLSLGIRLFINLMAGHTLLKVIIGFAWDLLLVQNFFSVFLIIPMITLVVLFTLELGVALIQAYVFVILTCIYLQDGS